MSKEAKDIIQLLLKKNSYERLGHILRLNNIHGSNQLILKISLIRKLEISI